MASGSLHCVKCAPSLLIRSLTVCAHFPPRYVFHNPLNDIPLLTSPYSLAFMYTGIQLLLHALVLTLAVTCLSLQTQPGANQHRSLSSTGSNYIMPRRFELQIWNRPLFQVYHSSSALERHEEYSYTLYHHSLTILTLYYIPC